MAVIAFARSSFAFDPDELCRKRNKKQVNLSELPRNCLAAAQAPGLAITPTLTITVEDTVLSGREGSRGYKR